MLVKRPMVLKRKSLQLVYEPDERLHTVCAPFDLVQLGNKNTRYFLSALRVTMKRAKGVGIAAPQVGECVRVCWVSRDGTHAILLINPVITSRSHEEVFAEEGCLSIPGVFGDVLRAKTVDITYYDADGVQQTLQAEDFLARVIQHEIDHLDGILFTSKARNIHKSVF